MNYAVDMERRVRALELELRRVRAGLVRMGTIASVQPDQGTVTVLYPSGVESATMPWFQRGSEHRPPRVGEHAVVLDPSLQGTAAIAIAGHPSEAQPPAEQGGEKHVLHADPSGDADTYESGTRTLRARRIDHEAADVRLGRNAADFVALASRVDAFISTLDRVLRTWVPVAQDGGAALKTLYTNTLRQPPQSVASSVVRTA